MDLIQHSLKLTGEVDVNSGIQNTDYTRTFNIVTVRGLGSVDSKEAAFPWQLKGNSTPTEDISAFLSFNDAKSRSLDFQYSISKQQRNIGIDSVDFLARALLDGLVDLSSNKDASVQSSDDFVFLGRDLGGLIIKQALSLARWTEKYHFVAAKTTALIFFETPHWAIPTETSWENLANWLLSISQWKCLSSVDWIYGTAHMIESVCGDFEGSQRLYDVVNVTISPNLDPGWKRKVKELGWSTVVFEGDLSNSNEAMESICRAIKSSSGPGMHFIHSLRMLATMSLARLRNPTPLDSRGRASPNVVDTQSELCKWNKGTCGIVNIIPAPGDDPGILISNLVAAQSDGKSSTAVILYVFQSNRFEADDAMIVMASICYQLLYQKPQLFDHVSRLLEALRKLDEDGIWPANKLFILFRSLLSCPHEGKMTCVLWEQRGTKFPQNVLDQLVNQASNPNTNFKLAFIRSGNGESPAESIYLPEMADLDTILDGALDVFLNTRPGLQSVRSTLRTGLRSQYDAYKADIATHHRAMSDIFQIWLELITRLAIPVSVASLERTLPQMPHSIDDLYTQVLNRTCHFTKSKLADILAWIVLPPTQLSAAELATALALDSNTKSFVELKNNKPADLEVDLVAELGAAVPIFGRRRSFHQQDLMQILTHQLHEITRPEETMNGQYCLPEAHFRLAKLCLIFLRLHMTQSVADLISSLDQHPFLWYAVSNWPVHYAKGKKESEDLHEVPVDFHEFFDDNRLIDFWAGMHHGIQHPGISSPPECALSAAAEVGCLELVQSLLERSGNEARSAAFLAAIDRADVEMVVFFQAAGITSPFALHVAVSSGQRFLLEYIVPSEENLATYNPLGYMPLHCACQDGTLEIVDDLLQAGADAGAKSNGDESTPLHVASMFGHVSVIQKLASKDVSGLYVTDKQGRTPLDYACEYQQPYAVRAILEIPGVLERLVHDSEESECPLFFHIAARTGRMDIVDLLLGISSDGITDTPETDRKDILDQICTWKDEDGCTALHLSARDGHAGVTREILCQEASKLQAITMQDNEDNIPLHLASRMGYANIVELLLQYNPSEQLNACGDGENRMTPIHFAVRYGHVGVVQLLVKAHVANEVSLDLFDNYPRSALHYAALRGHERSVQLLVGNGATVGIADYEGATPLHLACRHGYDKVASLLIDHSSDIKLCDENGMTPLLDAARIGNIAIMERLIRAGASWEDKDKQGRNVLHHVVSSNMVAFLFVLGSVQKTDSPDQRISLWDKDDNDMTALEVAASGNMLREILGLKQVTVDEEILNRMLRTAAQAGHLENVEYLVKEKKASPEDENADGRTALSFAAEKGHLQVVEFLAPQTPTTVDSEGNTPLYYASHMGHTDVASALLAIPDRSEISIANSDELTPIAIAVQNKHVGTVKLLLEKGADPNSPVDDGILLHWAAEYGYTEIVECLVGEADIRGEEKNKNGFAPMYLAAWYGEDEVVKQLIKSNFLANFPQGEDGRYPLHAAYDNAKIIELLIDQAKMDVNTTDAHGRTVLHHASQSSFLDEIDILLQRGADAWRTDDDGNTPLHLADNTSVVQKLLGSLSSKPCKSWKTIENKKGYTVLLAAIEAGNASIVEYLLDQEDCDVHVNDEILEAVVFQQKLEMLRLPRKLWPKEFLKRTDEHGWTYEQIIDSAIGKYGQRRGLPGDSEHDHALPGSALQPSAWALAEDDAILAPSPEKKDGPVVRAKFEDGYRALALANHPVPPEGQFYFTVRVIQEVRRIVGVGVARKGCFLGKMPGWENDTWGLHGDDGGFFHDLGWSIEKKEECEYGIGDEVGVFVDTREQKVFYSINNRIIDTGFKNVCGPVFPAVGLGPGCEIEAMFGSPDGTNPFKDAEGMDQIRNVSNWIG